MLEPVTHVPFGRRTRRIPEPESLALKDSVAFWLVQFVGLPLIEPLGSVLSMFEIVRETVLVFPALSSITKL